MRKVYPALLLLAIVIQCSAQTQADPQYEGSLWPSFYSGGYVLNWDAPAYTQVSIYSPETKISYSCALKGDEGRFYGVWAIDSDGVAARAYRSKGNPGGQIELLDRGGKPVQSIITGSYLAQHIAFAPDHTLWTVGYETRYESRTEDFNVVRHYARNGDKISEGLPWLEIAGDYNAYTSLQLCLGDKQLYAGNDRIGFQTLLHEGRQSWIEISSHGTLLEKYDLGKFRELSYKPLTMTAGGDVYARILKEDQFDGWAVLDRSEGQWRRVRGYPKGTLIGSDGENVIFSERDGGWTVLHSIPSSSLQIEPLKKRITVATLPE